MCIFTEVSAQGDRVTAVWRRLKLWGIAVLIANTAFAAGDDWRYVRTENFEMLSQASEKKTRAIVVELEQFRASFLSTFRLRPAHEPKVTVILFDSDRRFTPYKPTYKGRPKDVSGYFIGGDDETVIALNLDVDTDDESSPAETIFHEYVHLLLHTRGLRLPTWLNEGLAELFSTFRVEGNFVEYGRPKQVYVDILNLSSLMPIATMLGVTEESKYYNEEDRAGIFYAQAWAFTHFLVCGEDRSNMAKLSRYLSATEVSSVGTDVLFREAFGSSTEKMEQQLRAYLQGGRYFQRRVPAPLKEVAAKVSIRLATEAERDLALINLRWRVHRSGETMLAALHYADKNPTLPRPQELLGAVEASDGNISAALGRWLRAAELGSDSPFVLLRAAQAKLFERRGSFDLDERLAGEEAAQLRSWLDHSVRISPAYDDAWALLAQVESRAAEFRVSVVNELQSRVNGMKDPNPTLIALAVIRWRNKDRETASGILRAVTESARADKDTKAAARWLAGRMDEEVSAKPTPGAKDPAGFITGPRQVDEVQGNEIPKAGDPRMVGGQVKVGSGGVFGSDLPLPGMRKGFGKSGTAPRPAPVAKVQPLILPTEEAIVVGAGGEARGDLVTRNAAITDEQLVERVAAAAVDAVNSGAADTSPKVIYRTAALYPAAQRKEGIAGVARVRFTVQANGQPGKVRAVEATVPDFGTAAAQCVQQWRFIPAIKAGKPVDTLVDLTLTFAEKAK